MKIITMTIFNYVINFLILQYCKNKRTHLCMRVTL